MNWAHLGMAALLASMACSLLDWFFGAVLFHEKYKAHPEVWRRPQGGPGEGRAVGLSSLVSLLTPLAFVGLCGVLHLADLGETALLAAAIWLIAPVPLLVTNYFFMKIHPLVLLSHALGWLAKLGAAAVIAAWWLP